MSSEAARKAWRTRRKNWGRLPSMLTGKAKKAAKKARATMKKGKRIKIHSQKIKVNGSAKTTFAPPKKWWDLMTKQPHGSAGKPLSPAAAGHLWFKAYNNDKRLQIIKEYG